MIISASRRTDLPAFYSEWFMNRLREGYFIRVNPFNLSQRKQISLARSEVEAFIFWSKNPQPLIPHLATLDAWGYPYYFQFTLNDYPAVLEPRVPALENRVATFLELGARLGPERVVWRYDPIVLSRLTPPGYHLEAFERLARRLVGATRRVVISFLEVYPKVRTRFAQSDPENRLEIGDLRNETASGTIAELVGGLSAIAGQHHISMFSCAQKQDWSDLGVQHSSCIDGGLLNSLFGLELKLKKDPAQRPECGCMPAVDMGAYNTCPFLCSYCYANHHEATVARAIRNHCPDHPSL